MSSGECKAWDQNRVLDAMHKVEEDRASRRSFLKRGAAVAAGASAAALSAGKPASAQTPANPTLALPYQSQSAMSWIQFHIINIINDEKAHLSGLTAELGDYARPTATFQNLSVSTLEQYVAMGSLFCQTGAGAYLGAGPYIMNPALLAEASSIGQVELAQSAYLNSLLGQPFLPGGSPYAVALTLGDILVRAAPYVASLNGGPEPIFSTTPSFQNDVAIFNVALLLEQLENAFYNMNYPKFFS